MGELKIVIRKPLYNNFCYLNNDKIRLAQARKWNLKVILPEGEAIYTPEEWLKGAKYLEKVFLYKDNPMKMYGRLVIIGHKPKMSKKEKKLEEFWNKYNSADEETKFKMTH